MYTWILAEKLLRNSRASFHVLKQSGISLGKKKGHLNIRSGSEPGIYQSWSYSLINAWVVSVDHVHGWCPLTFRTPINIIHGKHPQRYYLSMSLKKTSGELESKDPLESWSLMRPWSRGRRPSNVRTLCLTCPLGWGGSGQWMNSSPPPKNHGANQANSEGQWFPKTNEKSMVCVPRFTRNAPKHSRDAPRHPRTPQHSSG